MVFVVVNTIWPCDICGYMSDEDLTGVSMPKRGRPSLEKKSVELAYEKVFITDG